MGSTFEIDVPIALQFPLASTAVHTGTLNVPCISAAVRKLPAGEICVVNKVPPLLRVEEESFVLLDRSAESESPVIPAHGRTGNLRRHVVTEVVVRVQLIVAKKFIRVSVKRVGAAPRDNAHFPRRAAPMFRKEVGASHLEFGDGIDTRIS